MEIRLGNAKVELISNPDSDPYPFADHKTRQFSIGVLVGFISRNPT